MLSERFNCQYVASMLVATLIAGCGGGDGTKPIANLVACSGTVIYDGKPLDHGTVYFTPDDPNTGKAASGRVSGGSFTMMTTVSAPGVVAGKYKVAVESVEPLKSDGQHPPIGNAPSLIPAKYTNIKTSNLSADVTKGMSAVKFELKKE